MHLYANTVYDKISVAFCTAPFVLVHRIVGSKYAKLSFLGISEKSNKQREKERRRRKSKREIVGPKEILSQKNSGPNFLFNRICQNHTQSFNLKFGIT